MIAPCLREVFLNGAVSDVAANVSPALDIDAPERHLHTATTSAMSNASTHAAENQALTVATPEGDALPLRAAARAAGLSESTLRRLVADGLVEAVRDAGGTMRVTSSTVLELRTGGVRRRGPSVGAREAERARGALAAQVFALLRSAVPLDQIVEQLECDPAVLRALVDEYVRCREISVRLLSAPEAPLGPAPAAVEAAARARGEQ